MVPTGLIFLLFKLVSFDGRRLMGQLVGLYWGFDRNLCESEAVVSGDETQLFMNFSLKFR